MTLIKKCDYYRISSSRVAFLHHYNTKMYNLINSLGWKGYIIRVEEEFYNGFSFLLCSLSRRYLPGGRCELTNSNCLSAR